MEIGRLRIRCRIRILIAQKAAELQEIEPILFDEKGGFFSSDFFSCFEIL